MVVRAGIDCGWEHHRVRVASMDQAEAGICFSEATASRSLESQSWHRNIHIFIHLLKDMFSLAGFKGSLSLLENIFLGGLSKWKYLFRSLLVHYVVTYIYI